MRSPAADASYVEITEIINVAGPDRCLPNTGNGTCPVFGEVPTAAPPVSTAAPPVSTGAPEVTTAGPPPATAAPEATTAAPGVTGVTTAAPPATTALPEATTAALTGEVPRVY